MELPVCVCNCWCREEGDFEEECTRMCYSVECSHCGKTSWAGCGLHVRGVYNTIPDKDKDLCLCKGWPGVELPPHLAARVPESATGSGCHIL